MPVENSWKVVLVSAGVGNPSTTQMLGDRIAKSTIKAAESRNRSVDIVTVDLRDLAEDLTNATVSGIKSEALNYTLELIDRADGLIATSPVYKAAYSGLFKMFFDLMDDDALLAMPVVLGATAGTPRHALVPDQQMRPLFAYLRAVVSPTSIFAATEDWGNSKLQERIDRVAAELVGLLQGHVRRVILESGKSRYRTTFKANGEGADGQVDFDTDLMKLAAGGK